MGKEEKQMRSFPGVAEFLDLDDLLSIRAASRRYLALVSALSRVAALGTRYHHYSHHPSSPTSAHNNNSSSHKSKTKARRDGSPKSGSGDSGRGSHITIPTTALLLSFRSLETLFPKLAVFEIKRVPLLTSRIFGMDGMPTRLIRLNLHDISEIDPDWTAMASSGVTFPSVNHLQCARIGGFGNALTSFIMCFPSLCSLELQDCFPIENRDLPVLCSGLSNLTCLIVSECMQISHVDVRLALSLTHLSVTRCPLLRGVQTSPNLLSCSFEGSSIRSTVIEAILRYCVDLMDINLRGCRSLSSLTIRSRSLCHVNMLGCSSLKTLVIMAPVLSDIDLLCCDALELLSINSAMLRRLNLCMLQSLKQLQLKCASLRHINLSGCSRLEYFGLPSADIDTTYAEEEAEGSHSFSTATTNVQLFVSPSQLLLGCPLLEIPDDGVFAATPLYRSFNEI